MSIYKLIDSHIVWTTSWKLISDDPAARTADRGGSNLVIVMYAAVSQGSCVCFTSSGDLGDEIIIRDETPRDRKFFFYFYFTSFSCDPRAIDVIAAARRGRCIIYVALPNKKEKAKHREREIIRPSFESHVLVILMFARAHSDRSTFCG